MSENQLPPALQKRAEFLKKQKVKIEYGQDCQLSLSVPQYTLVERSDWMMDEDTKTCIICSQAFNFTNRRHHCRRCGRVLCSKCCPKQSDDRYCILCYEILLQQQQNDAQIFNEHDLTNYFGRKELLAVINGEDYLLYGELIRLFQNQMRNDRCRDQLLDNWPQLFVKVLSLITECVKQLTNKNKKQFFIQSKNKTIFGPQEASPALSNSLGLLINFTGSQNNKYANYLVNKSDIIEKIYSVFTQEIDLSRREQAIWVLKNLSQSKEGCLQISQNAKFAQVIFEMLLANVTSINESVFSLMCNVLRNQPDQTQFLLPLQNIPNVAKKNDLLTLFFIKFAKYSCLAKVNLLKSMAHFCEVIKARDVVLDSGYFNQVLDLLLEYQIVEEIEQQQCDSDEICLVAAALYSLQVIIAASKEDLDFLDKIKDKVTNNKFVKQLLLLLSDKNQITHIYASKLVQTLFVSFEDDLKLLFDDNEKLRKLFVQAMATCLADEQPFFSEPEKLCKAIYKQLGKNNDLSKSIKQIFEKLSAND